ncbi:hypothetical protein AB2T85_06615 [Clostridium butyricum]|uniref:Uncharacterized protein n=1 Tax=Clostridium butyricum TaxID=1492 RepID=A0A6L9EQ12_CLOBU|nr:hypothetical protein [Clostridium butyricum]
MKIIRGDRRSGKTTELIKKSHDEWKYIICRDRQRVEFIESYARELNIEIPFPIEVRELPLRSNFIKSAPKATDEKPNPEPVWKVISYHPNLESAFKSIVDDEVILSASSGIDKIMKTLQELKDFKYEIL